MTADSPVLDAPPVVPAPAPVVSPSQSSRLVSLDALRGFDMFWIIGAGTLVGGLEKMNANPVTTFLAAQLKHAQWVGFNFEDLIFPLFLCIIGVSLVFSLDRLQEERG
jgi:predicted acyltransferase